MTTWGQLLTEVRIGISDALAGSERWSDEELLYACHDAIIDFSGEFPKRRVIDLISTGVATIELPEDVTSLNAVEYKTKLLQEIPVIPGKSFSNPTGYVLSSDGITLYPTPASGDVIRLHANCLYSLPALEVDTIDVPRVAHLALKYLIRAIAIDRQAVEDSLLSRWAEETDKGFDRRDNPLIPMAAYLRRCYDRELAKLDSNRHYSLRTS